MKLSKYPRPSNDTGLGIHAGGSCSFPLGEDPGAYGWWLDEMEAMGVRWVKLLAGNRSALEPARMCLARGMMPIVRFYINQPNPGALIDRQPDLRIIIPEYISAGVKYIETNNEPNLLDEWVGGWGSSDSDPTPWKEGAQPDRVAEAWVKDATFVLEHGGLPGTPALAPGGNYNDMDFFRTFLRWLNQRGYRNLFLAGAWIAIHNATFNHPLDYPYDAVNQTGVPVSEQEYAQYSWRGSIDYVNGERQRGKNPGMTLITTDAQGKDTGASNCWRKFDAVEDAFFREFGFVVPVLSTEGGVWEGEGADPRYPIVSLNTLSQWTVEFSRKMMANAYPDYYFTTCPWLIANRGMGNTYMAFEHQAWYSYTRENGHMPVVDAMKGMEKQVKRGPRDDVVPAIDGITEGPTEPAKHLFLTDEQLVRYCRDAGFGLSDDVLTTAVAIVLAESGGDALAVNTTGNYPASRDRGLWQINDYYHPEVSDAMAFDPAGACAAAFVISNRGTNFSPWSSYSSRAYMAYWERSASAVRAGAPVLPLADFLTNLAWNQMGVPYTPQNALCRYAVEHDLGMAMTDEFQFIYQCVPYVGQVFHKTDWSLLYCKLGQYDTVYVQRVG